MLKKKYCGKEQCNRKIFELSTMNIWKAVVLTGKA